TITQDTRKNSIGIQYFFTEIIIRDVDRRIKIYIPEGNVVSWWGFVLQIFIPDGDGISW
ncbi:MAG: hypothetical protein GW789_16035, partial [Ignavibacteria bacterium]|nr:hypothetical protein [Ignavibacteria bacterium]